MTLSFENWWFRWEIPKDSVRGLSFQQSHKNLILLSFPITQLVLSLTFLKELFMSLQKEENTWYLIQFPPLMTIFLIMLARCTFQFIISQHYFRFEASFRVIKDIMPNPPCSIGLQHICQATMTNFLLSNSPLLMKFWIHFSIHFRTDMGQE